MPLIDVKYLVDSAYLTLTFIQLAILLLVATRIHYKAIHMALKQVHSFTSSK